MIVWIFTYLTVGTVITFMVWGFGDLFEEWGEARGAMLLMSALFWPAWLVWLLVWLLRPLGRSFIALRCRLWPRDTSVAPKARVYQSGMTVARIENCVAEGDIVAIVKTSAKAGEFAEVSIDCTSEKT